MTRPGIGAASEPPPTSASTSTVAEAHAHSVLAAVASEQEVVVRLLVQPPAVYRVPWGMRIAGARSALACCAFLMLELRERRRRQRVGRHGAAWAREFGAMALDE